jgi:hypothetical protein
MPIAAQLATAFEGMLAHLCGANVRPFAEMRLGVIEYDKNQNPIAGGARRWIAPGPQGCPSSHWRPVER